MRPRLPGSSKGDMAPRELEDFAGAPVVGMVSLGCPKNTVDSERVLGMLAEAGFIISADPAAADVVLVNTCAFIEPAREESFKVIRRLARLGVPVVALGCMAEKFKSNADGKPVFSLTSAPHVASFVRFKAYDRLPQIARRLAGVSRAGGRLPGASCFEKSPRLRIGPPGSAYLKIAEGCSNRCRYCSVPLIKGPLRSRPMEEILDEAESIVGLGARELCVIAQDTTQYGTDIYGRRRLCDFLRKLCEIRRLGWVRLLYVHPARLTSRAGRSFREELIDVLTGEKKMCSYLDLPLQHVSSRMLKAMGRGYDGPQARALVEELRRRVSGIALRTSLIVGLPGETEREFRELFEFVREARFEHMGVFVYSPEEGTPAARLPGRPSPRTAASRRRRLMRLQQRIAFEHLDSRVGGVERVLLDLPPAKREGSFWTARSRSEAPEVDGQVLVKDPRTPAHRSDAEGKSAERLRPGQLVNVRIVSRSGYDLVAEALSLSKRGKRR